MSRFVQKEDVLLFRAVATLPIVILTVTGSVAAQGSATPEERADAVLAAADKTTLEVLASQAAPDRWLVVEELLRRGRRDVARRYAAAVPAPTGEPLARFADTGTIDKRDAQAALALERAREAGAAKNWVEAIAHADAAVASSPAPITRVRALYAKGKALWILKRYKDGAAALASAGDAAKAMGWWRPAVLAYRLCGFSHVRFGDLKGAIAAWDLQLAAATTLGDHVQRASALNNTGVALEQLGRREESFKRFQAWAAAADAAGDPGESSRAHRAVGEGLLARGRYRDALSSCEKALEAAHRSKNKVHIGTAHLARGSARSGLGDAKGAVEDDAMAFRLAQETRDLLLAARARNNAGVALEKLGRIDEAFEAFTQACALAERVRNAGAHLDASANLARVVGQRGDPARALTMFDSVIARARSAGRRDVVATCSTQRGSLLFAAGRYEEALTAHKEAYDLSMSLGRQSDAAHALGNTAIVFHRRGESKRALDAFKETLALAERTGDRVLVARTLRWIGVVLERLGEHDDARQFLERALAMSREANNPRTVHDSLLSLGNLEEGRGAHRAALAHYQTALQVAEGLGYPRDMAASLMNLGNSSASLGRFRQALEFYLRSTAAFSRLDSRPDVAALTLNVASVHQRVGRFAEALATYERALELMRGLDDFHNRALVYNNLGMLHLAMGDTARATSRLEEALAIHLRTEARDEAVATLTNLGLARQIGGDVDGAVKAYKKAIDRARGNRNHANLMLALGRLGRACLEGGRHDEARAAFEESLRLAEAGGATSHIGGALVGLGTLHLESVRPADALACFERAIALREGAERPPWFIDALVGAARALLGLERADEAASRAREASAAVQSYFLGLGIEQAARGRDEWAGVFAVAVEAAVAAGSEEAVFAMLEGGRAGSLMEALQTREALWSLVIPEELRDAQLQARSVEQRAAAALRRARSAGKRKDIRIASEQLEAARRRRSDVLARIERAAKRISPLRYSGGCDLDGCRALLAADEALVIFGASGRRVIALVATRAHARIVDVAARKEVDALLRALLPDESPHVHVPSLPAARKTLIESLGLPRSVRRVLVSPADRVAYVPFAAVAPELEFVFVPSASVYRALRDRRAARGEGILAVGDPAYDAKSGSGFVPLPGTRREVEAVGTVTLTGSAATESGFLAALGKRGRWRAVHLACHGVIDAETPRASALALAVGKGDDGLLTGQDLVALRVDADLAVLSACDTARGRIYRTEGILGLTHGFMCAGAPRVVCSLWKVDDEATRALMVKFYELWNPKDGTKGIPAATALKKAQAFVRGHETWKHPFYWAAWQLWGLGE